VKLYCGEKFLTTKAAEKILIQKLIRDENEKGTKS